MKRFCLFLSVLNLFTVFSHSQEKADIPWEVYPVREKTEILSLDGNWKFKFFKGLEVPAEYAGFELPDFDDTGWGYMEVPGNWEIAGYKAPEYGGDLEACTGLYRKKFIVDTAWKSRHVFIRFDGVLFSLDVYVNGVYIGEWGSAFNMCQFDVTPWIRYDDVNTVAVKVSTRSKGWRFDLNDDWALTGIFRSVEMFSVPDLHICDVTFRSFLPDSGLPQARLQFTIDMASYENEVPDAEVQVLLSDDMSQNVLACSQKIQLQDNRERIVFEKTLDNPLLWTAETPYLYGLEVRIVRGTEIIQRIREKVGIREVSVLNNVLCLNNKPITLRGVCMNEIHPLTGRAMTEKQLWEDLLLMKKANVNYIRTAHYPFQPRFHELCDQLGFYVFCEVPFGYGDSNLNNPAYQDELYRRAEATVSRDKNHPSIIVWTVGNENPYTPLVENTVRYVKQKDPTRPRALPMAGGIFLQNVDSLSDNVSLYTFHYQSTKTVERMAKLNRKPIVLTEYAHSLGLAFDALESQYDMMRKYDNIAGGSVWTWADQALLRSRSGKDFELDTCVQGVWLDSVRYYDSHADRGTDGIVYADRYPQEDYWLLRKVYSPVSIDMVGKHMCQNDSVSVELLVSNHYDFISLSGLQCKWQLKDFQTVLQAGVIDLHTPARERDTVCIDFSDIPADSRDLQLDVSIGNPLGQVVYETVFPIREIDVYKDFLEKMPASKLRVKKVKNGYSVAVGKFLLTVMDDGKLKITDPAGRLLVDSYLLLRTGRKPTLNQVNLATRRKDVFYWNPYLLKPEISIEHMDCSHDTCCLILNGRWSRAEKSDEFLEGKVILSISAQGVVTFDYDLSPHNLTGTFLECGLSLELGALLDVFHWLGMGPFTTTPGKSAYNKRGIWALHKDDFRFVGNRQAELCLFSSSLGSAGIGYVSTMPDVSVENLNGNIVFTNNVYVSGYGTKLSQPTDEVKAHDVESVKGRFSLFLYEAGNELLDTIFQPLEPVLPELPFYKSYGH